MFSFALVSLLLTGVDFMSKKKMLFFVSLHLFVNGLYNWKQMCVK